LKHKDFLFLCIFLTLALTSCRKEKVGSTFYERVQLPNNGSVFSVIFKNDTLGYCCGGIRNKKGFICKTSDSGKNWTVIAEKEDTCIYDIVILNDSLLVSCGDYLSVFFSQGNDTVWKVYKYSFELVSAYSLSLRSISYNKRGDLIFAGGNDFDKGGVLRFIENKVFWNFFAFSHEAAACHAFENGQALVCCYGTIYMIDNEWKNQVPVKIKGDFFISVSFTSSELGYAAGFDGNLYKTVDGGINWEKILDQSRTFKHKVHFNSVAFLTDALGFAAGNNGLLITTTDGGVTWKKLGGPSKSNLLKLYFKGTSTLLITDDQGNIFKLGP
jgi:photosystem II stability/assembly factor-like uncharacterized protein